jgi:hypothetical protein
LTALTVVALAFGASDTSSALVTLQVAPRGPGSVSAVPKSVNDNQSCTAQDGTKDCTWSYERGTSVVLTAKADGAGKSFSGWSDPECGSNTSCTVKLDDDLTSVVAVFAPLILGVKFSDDDGGASVKSDPAGQPCDSGEQGKAGGGAEYCRTFAPHTRVKLTVTPGTTSFTGWNDQGDYLCEPANATTCTISVEDQPTWAGARFNNNNVSLPTTITVEFHLRKSGNGSGRVTASKMDCGTVCSAKYGFGKSIALTATEDNGSLFDGWNGVCAKTQKTCTFPAGPITSIRAVFSRDATAPGAPGTPVVGKRTRTSIAVAWTASTDNVGVSGYRIYLNDASAGDTKATEFTLEGLKCGRDYAVAVDAADAVGNRSQRAGLTTATLPCALAARLAGVGIARAGANRIVVVKLRVNRVTTARLRLLRGKVAVATARFAVKPGTNTLRLRVPRKLPRGPYRLAMVLANPDGGTLAVPGRNVLLPGP